MAYKISVVMSVFNAELYLKEAIDSILNQTFSDFEFIIINDGSTDKSLEIIKSYSDQRIKIINQNNTGLPKALNHGISITKTDYIARMDADDIAFPERLEKQFEFLSKNPNHIVVGSNARIIDLDGNYIFTSNQPLTNNEIRKNLPNTPFFHPSVMFKKEYFKKAGKYPEYMLKGQDLVLFNRMSKFGKLANMSDCLINYRIVPSANSNRDGKISKAFYKVLLKAIESNEISKEDQGFIKTLTSNRDSKFRIANYHLYLAKKYLWNNYQPKLSRKNLIISLKIKFNKYSVFYYFVSFLPEKTIKKLYEGLK